MTLSAFHGWCWTAAAGALRTAATLRSCPREDRLAACRPAARLLRGHDHADCAPIRGRCTGERSPFRPAGGGSPFLEFLDRVFDESVARSPQTLTGLGIKQRYGELDDYTDAENIRQREFSERSLAQMKAQFDPAGSARRDSSATACSNIMCCPAARRTHGAGTAFRCRPTAAPPAPSPSS
jgi:hypothetical protein